jgi:hypothetical protein
MPTPPEGTSSHVLNPSMWAGAGIALGAALKWIRDATKARRPSESASSPSLHVAIATMTRAISEMSAEVKELREVIVASHSFRLTAIETDRRLLRGDLDDIRSRLAAIERIQQQQDQRS